MNYKKLAKWVLFILLVITCLQGYFLTKLQFNYDFESYFPKDKDLSFFSEFRDRFENDSDYLLIGIKDNTSIYNQEVLTYIKQLTKELKKVPHIEQVISPTNIKIPILGLAGPIQKPAIHLKSPERYAADSSYISKSPDLVSSFFSKDGKSAALFVKHKNMITREESAEMMESFNELIGNHSFDEIHVAGRVQAETEYVRKLQIELSIFVSTSILLIILFLYISFRSWWGIIVPMIVVMLSVFWCIGTMTAFGNSINLMTVLMPTIMFVVGMSDVVHIISKYLEELRKGHDKIDALKTTFKEVGMATFLTSLTTSIGFFTLMTSGIGPINSFGLYTGVGVFLAFILAFTLLPAILLFQKKPKVTENKKIFWIKQLHMLFSWIMGNQKKVIVTFIGLTTLAFIGISQIKVDAKLIDELADSDPMKQDFLFFENLFSGVRPFELAVSLKDSSESFFDYKNVQELHEIDTYVRKEFELNNTLSPLTVIKTVNRALNGGQPTYYSIPTDPYEFERVTSKIQKFKRMKGMQTLLSKDEQHARVSGNMVDIGSNRSLKLMQQFKDYINSKKDKLNMNYRLTGSAYLIDTNNNSLSVNMLYGLSIAFAVIALLMGMLYKSFKIVIVSLIPNIIPLLWIAGIMGFFDLNLKMSSAIIFTIAFGIAVDDTIHFMSKLKIELSKGRTMLYAIKRTFLSTGKAIIITSCILIGGFLTLIFSSFEGTFFTGLLVSLTLIFAVIADLFLIPILLLIFFKNKKG
ncbi:MAG: RND family transporter [Cyclobacteriaceae bacterium]